MKQMSLLRKQGHLQERPGRERFIRVVFSCIWACLLFYPAFSFAAVDRGGWSPSSGMAMSGWQPNESSRTSAPIRYQNSSRNGAISPFSPGSHNLAVDLGQVFLIGELSQFSNNLGAQAHYTYGVSDLFGFQVSTGYSEHSDGEFSIFSLLTGMRVNLSWYDRMVPYLNFGLGFYYPSYPDKTSSSNNPSGEKSSDTAHVGGLLFGVHVGPGVSLEVSQNLFFGIGLTFHNIFSAKKYLNDGKPIDLGGNYLSFLLHLGATF